MDCFLSQYLLHLLLTFKTDVLKTKTAIPNSWYSSQIARFFYRQHKIILRPYRKFNATGSVKDSPWRPKHHVTTRQPDRYIRANHHRSDRHRTARKTSRNILEHVNGFYGRDDINSRVRKFLRSECHRTRPHKKWNNLPQRFIFYSIVGSLWDAVISANGERTRY